MSDKNPSFSLVLITNRKFKSDEAPVPEETWKIVLAVNCQSCNRPITDAKQAVGVLQGVNLEGLPGEFLDRVQGRSATEYFYAIRGKVSIVHSHCPTPVGLQIPANMLLAIHSPVGDFKPGLPMTDTTKRPN